MASDIDGSMKTADNAGLTPYVLVSAATTNATSVVASPCRVFGLTLTNVNASPRYVKLYDKASAPTVGTDTPKHVYMLPGGGGIEIERRSGIDFELGLAFATTTGAAHSDTGAVAANEVLVNIDYA